MATKKHVVVYYLNCMDRNNRRCCCGTANKERIGFGFTTGGETTVEVGTYTGSGSGSGSGSCHGGGATMVCNTPLELTRKFMLAKISSKVTRFGLGLGVVVVVSQ